MSLSELEVILADLARISEAFDMTKNDLGKEALDVVALGTADAIEQQRTADGDPWPELTEAYAEWKFEHVGVKSMGHLYEIMAQPAEIDGERDITREVAEWSFGVSAEARDEAMQFIKRRNFIGLSTTTIERLNDIFDRRFEDAVEGK